ncbi:SNF2 family N-terminal domain-containing protein [Radiomyces spectabilis]|uniref:SNF2 family N-terminal domain-containing protein n=1 Tax=Radiomyces spectabilis TaxID=64574 RepID=UPI00221E5CFD|nr:SNF2 family N-terminal domain-containing protein [Radiomyces spectabilis]KAI8374376.1 SNF2 family N-terminal domain-containing protein [Radiomyces spectabilis]
MSTSVATSYSISPINMAPGYFNKEKLNSLIKRAKSLQHQGANEENCVEFGEIMHFLRNVQAHPSTKSTSLSIDSATDHQTMSLDDPDADAPATTSLTSDQQRLLIQQMTAYRLISKNMPLPTTLQQMLLQGPSSRQAETTPTASASSSDKGHASLSAIDPSTVSTLSHAPLYSLSKDATLADASPLPSPQFPFPLDLDTETLLSERDRQLQARVQYRINELEKLPSNLLDDRTQRMLGPDEDFSNDFAPLSTIKSKAIIELKALRLLNKQKKLREEIMRGMNASTMLDTSVDRLAYRRMKKQTLREARMTEKIERQQRLDREYREKQKHLDYLQTICDHGRELIRVQETWRTKQSKLGRAVQQFHQHIEKEEQKKSERISKERILALKMDDEEAYMKLIDEAKDTRLTQLLKQTGSFLESLTEAVVVQQNEARYARDEFEPISDEDIEETDARSKTDYFQVTHRIKEQVSQPSILVGGKLKDYQVKGLQWMVSLYNNHLNGILADEMGLGKTIQTISLITYLIEKKKQNGPYLIIVPLSTLTNWTLEFEKWAPSVSKIVYKGTPTVRKGLQYDIRYGNFQVLLTTFEYIIKDRPILSKIKWLHMIIDEGHRMKNTNSKLTLVLRQYYHSRYRLILTGTPLQNNLPELWALLNFILPKIFQSVKSFEEWFNTPFNNQGVQDRIELNEEEQLLIIKRLHKVLRPFLLRRLKKDVEAELPDKVERVIKCRLSALQAKLYSQMKKNRQFYTGAKGKTGIRGLNNKIMQLRKICNHPFVFEEVENAVNPSHQSNNLLYRTSGKFELLDRILPKLQQTGHRVLIFFQMTQIMTIMEDFMVYRGYNYLRLDGSTKSDDRSQLLQMFNAPDSPYFAFLLSTRAGGLGLNLQSADTVIIFDSDWNPHQDLQAQDRAHRIGQTKEVRIFRLISTNSIEENILARANYKLDIDGKVIQAGKFDNRSTEEDREAFLRSLLEDKNDDQTNDEDEDLDDEELNEMLKRNESEIEVFNRIDAERERRDTEEWRRSGGRGKKPERLIQEDELPEELRHDEVVEESEGSPMELGRGQRVRDHVRYDDGLTEDQWLNALEQDTVDLDEVIAQKEARRLRRLNKRREANGNKGTTTVLDISERASRRRRATKTPVYEEDDHEGSEDDDTEEPPQEILPRKRGRPRKAESTWGTTKGTTIDD